MCGVNGVEPVPGSQLIGDDKEKAMKTATQPAPGRLPFFWEA